MNNEKIIIKNDVNQIKITTCGSMGQPGKGIITGGTTNQVLAKKSNTDYDMKWTDPSGYVLPTASNTIKGGIKIGDGLTMTGETLSANAQPYTLPIATSTILGGIKQGANVTIAIDGTLSASGEPQIQSDYAQVDNTKVDYIKNKPDLTVYATNTALSDKVDKITGKGLSTVDFTDTSYVHTDNNFTNGLKSTYDGYAIQISAKASQSDLTTHTSNTSNPHSTTASQVGAYTTSQVDTLLNGKVNTSGYVATDNNYTTADKNKLAGLTQYTDTMAQNALSSQLANKVNIVSGKGLSTNDLTNALKTSYDGAVTNSHTHSNKTILDNITYTPLAPDGSGASLTGYLARNLVGARRCSFGATYNLTSANVLTKVTGATESTTTGDFNATTQKYTVPYTGLYLLRYSGTYAAATTGILTPIYYYNGASATGAGAYNPGTAYSCHAMYVSPVFLNAGDYIEMYVQSTVASSVYCSINIALIGGSN